MIPIIKRQKGIVNKVIMTCWLSCTITWALMLMFVCINLILVFPIALFQSMYAHGFSGELSLVAIITTGLCSAVISYFALFKWFMHLVYRMDIWLNHALKNDWFCSNCGKEHSYIEYKPILNYVVQPDIDYYVQPTHISLCEKVKETEPDIKILKEKIILEGKISGYKVEFYGQTSWW